MTSAVTGKKMVAGREHSCEICSSRQVSLEVAVLHETGEYPWAINGS
jgi:hypothetical protein